MDIKKFKIVAYSLTLAGVIPFLGCLFGIFNHVHSDFYLQSLIAYGAIILTFLGGIHWGLALNYRKERIAIWLLFESILPAFIAWIVLLLSIGHWQLLLLGITFLFILLIDIFLYRQNIIESWFLLLRMIISGLVLIILCVSFMAVI